MRRLLVGVIAVGACVLAPTAQAAPTLTTDQIPVKAYKLSFSLARSGDGYTLSVVANRSAAGGTSNQVHLWAFPLSARAVKLTAAGATIKTGSELGRYGKIAMTIAAGAPKRTTLPCFVSAFVQRKGTLKGSFNLSLDGRYFKRVAKTSIPASISARFPAMKPSCGGVTPATGGGLTLSGFNAQDPSTGVSLAARRDAAGVVTQTATLMERTGIAPATSVMHLISATAGADGLAAADDLTTASLAFASPFLAGTASFAAMAGTASPTSAFGDLGGSVVVKFDSPAPQTITALSASLQRN